MDLQALVDETAQKVTRNASQHDGDASIGTAGLRGEGEFRWSSRGPRARENMELWLKHLTLSDSEPTPLGLEWGEEGLRIIDPLTSEDTDAETMATGREKRSDATSKMETPDRGVDSTMTQRTRRTRRRSKEGVGGALFGSAIILRGDWCLLVLV